MENVKQWGCAQCNSSVGPVTGLGDKWALNQADSLNDAFGIALQDNAIGQVIKGVGVVAVKTGLGVARAEQAAGAAATITSSENRLLNNFYRDGSSPDLIQQSYQQAAISSTHNAQSSEVILGKYIAGSENSYDAVARARGSTYFSMSDWSAVQGQLGADKMWNINKEFLDQQITQGKSFLFTANPASPTAGYFTKLEFQHLTVKGFVLIKDGIFFRAVKK